MRSRMTWFLHPRQQGSMKHMLGTIEHCRWIELHSTCRLGFVGGRLHRVLHCWIAVGDRPEKWKSCFGWENHCSTLACEPHYRLFRGQERLCVGWLDPHLVCTDRSSSLTRAKPTGRSIIIVVYCPKSVVVVIWFSVVRSSRQIYLWVTTVL